MSTVDGLQALPCCTSYLMLTNRKRRCLHESGKPAILAFIPVSSGQGILKMCVMKADWFIFRSVTTNQSAPYKAVHSHICGGSLHP